MHTFIRELDALARKQVRTGPQTRLPSTAISHQPLSSEWSFEVRACGPAPVLQPVQPRSRSRRGGGPRDPGRRPGLQRRADDRADAAGGRRARGHRGCSRSSACRRTPATTCSISARCSTAARTALAQHRRGVARPAARGGRRPAARRSTTCCSTAPRSSRAGEILGVVPKTYLPELSRVLRSAPVRIRRRARIRDERRPARPARRAVRQPRCCSRRASSRC